MNVSLSRLLSLFNREYRAGRSMVLAMVVRTEGPTYTKAGAMMVIAGDGEYAGLLSGGCLEGDLAEHCRAVLGAGRAKLVRYDMRSANDLLFGLGSGCEGCMDILLQRLDPLHGWQPLRRLVSSWQSLRPESLALVVKSGSSDLMVGSGVFVSDLQPFGPTEMAMPDSAVESRTDPPGMWARFIELAAHLPQPARSQFYPSALPDTDVLVVVQPAPPRILLLGAGPDAVPVAELAAFLGWSVVVIDHREHYAQSSRFPQAESVLKGGPSELAELIRRTYSTPANTARFAAAIVMSHHLLTDRGYLISLANSNIPYIGLLGPVSRRERLLAEVGALAEQLRPRLHAPMGLDLGAATPEAIALATIAEVHCVLAGRAPISPSGWPSADVRRDRSQQIT